MGRRSKGAITTGEALSIELSYLLKQRLLEKGCECYGCLSWSNAAKVRIETSYNTQAGSYIRLIYSKTDSETNLSEYDYKIYLSRFPSNLGKGEVLYFFCPQSGVRCRVLYMCYGSPIFKARVAYDNRIYYASQVSSKMNHANDRYWSLDGQIEKSMKSRRKQLTYKGRPTKYAIRLARLKTEQRQCDIARWQPSAIPKSLRKFF